MMDISIFTWWLAVQFLGIVALPITAILFDKFPLKGYAFSKVMGLLAVGYVSWLLAILRVAGFRFEAVFIASLLVLAAGLWGLGRSGLHELLATLRTHWRALLSCEVLFAAMLFAGLWIRWNGAVGAAILGTEKPMDLAFISGILKSGFFPPKDPWLAGFAINYYYLGYAFVAMLATLSGASVGEAFNLGLATTFALTALTIAGLLAALTASTRRPSGERSPASGVTMGALLGVIFVLILGNQSGAFQVLLGSSQVVALDGRQLLSAITERLQGQTTIQVDPPVSAADFGVISQLTPDPNAQFDWWWSSRAVWDDVNTGTGLVERRYAITEFPFFSFYLGDLHPHVLSLPFGILALALAFAALQGPLPSTLALQARGWVTVMVTALVLGGLYAINSLDAPTYALLYAGGLILGYRRESPGETATQILRKTMSALALVGLGTIVAYLPFLFTYQAFAGGRPVPEPWSRVPIVGSLAKMLLPAPDHTGLHEFLSFFGVFIFILLVYAVNTRSRRDPTPPAERGRTAWALSDRFIWLWPLVALLVGLPLGMPMFALLVLALVCGLVAWRYADRTARSFVLLSTAVGALAVFGPDLVYLRDPFENRMNTIFKFYYQAWVIWGTSAAYAACALLRRARRRPLFTLVWGIPALLLFLGALVYPLEALRHGQAWVTTQPTLDGLAYWRDSSPDEAAAFQWIIDNTQPGDTVLTAVGNSYDGSTGWAAAVTGRSTLLGWSGSHERLWRSRSPTVLEEVAARERDIPVIYTTTDHRAALQLLERYNVQYVYIGPAERRFYAGQGLDKFDSMLKLVFQQGDVRIYRCP